MTTSLARTLAAIHSPHRCDPADEEILDDASGTLVRPAETARAPVRMSTVPLVPNVAIASPVLAFDLPQSIVRRQDQPAVGAIGVLPISEAALGGFGWRRRELFAGRGVEGDDHVFVPATLVTLSTISGLKGSL